MAEKASDPHNLQRFLDAQATTYDRAIAELAAGCKQSHWMWFVFPQIEGLGKSATARHYAIHTAAEARAYLDHSLLGRRLVACCETLLRLKGRSALEILGSPDDLKLRSCATLFAAVAPPGSVFHAVLDRFFQGMPDPHTLRRLGIASLPSAPDGTR